jgi:hypothetical protein
MSPEKRLQAMRANPRGDWTMTDVEVVCRVFGLSCDPPRGGGSHYKVNHPQLNGALTIPFKRPIKPVYIRRLVELIDLVNSLR